MTSSGLCFRAIPFLLRGPDYDSRWATQKGADHRSYSLRFDIGAKSIVFTGDTGPSDAVVNLAKDADVLVTEVIDVPGSVKYALLNVPGANPQRVAEHMEMEHLTPEEIGKIASRANVKMVVLHHFSPGQDGEADTSVYVDGIRKYFSGPVIVGRDLTELNIDTAISSR